MPAYELHLMVSYGPAFNRKGSVQARRKSLDVRGCPSQFGNHILVLVYHVLDGIRNFPSLHGFH